MQNYINVKLYLFDSFLGLLIIFNDFILFYFILRDMSILFPLMPSKSTAMSALNICSK